MTRLPVLALAGLLPVAAPIAAPMSAQAAPIEVLFVGNSYTFGRVDPVMSYNAANVADLTSPDNGGNFTDLTGGNAFEPRPWGGVPGVFKKLTDQAGLDYAVSHSTRNAASLRGHFLNTNPADWDLRGNIGLKTWDKVVLQEQSDEVLPRQTNAAGRALASNPEYTRYFADIIEDYLHSPGPYPSIRYREAFEGANNAEQTANCMALTRSSEITCNRNRNDDFANPNASEETEVFLYQTWARPNLVDGAFATETDETTGDVTRSTELSQNTHYASLAEMTDDLVTGYAATVAQAAADGSGGLAGVAPVGEAFQRAVDAGLATEDFWGPDALTDGLIDLWFDDGTHASKFGSYLSALVIYGTLTGLDPAGFGPGELAAMELGIDPQSATVLQRVASDQLGFGVVPIPLPAAAPMAVAALALLGFVGRRRRG
ncbi:hypothetical protein [Rubrimonas cliftonensis]|uniref:VPLPA-CTERM protein sorting domain-containing protein n=1 Tax=Rubrimonas cliftonensis TaxID=89524 RepID=A0A1H4FM57_9RHOB|nr:hypothetical protein [Rubrimonas cliftonensis]SEA98384.1 hypothetical protein SAMN05444370_12511 [Rubrimonas cliftonensis]